MSGVKSKLVVRGPHNDTAIASQSTKAEGLKQYFVEVID